MRLQAHFPAARLHPARGGFLAFADADGVVLDVLADNAFGNYRDILQAVSTHPAMGQYLTRVLVETGVVAADPVPARRRRPGCR